MILNINRENNILCGYIRYAGNNSLLEINLKKKTTLLLRKLNT
jgi:hypothetical protein